MRGNQRMGEGREPYEEASNAGQILSSVMNAPGTSGLTSWSTLWPFANENGQTDASYGPTDPALAIEVSKEDFHSYLSRMSGKYENFVNIHEALGTMIMPTMHYDQQSARSPYNMGSVGQGLVQAMKEVPYEYFDPDFSLTNPEEFEKVCPAGSEASRMETLEKLTLYLDVVELNLTQEISSRSTSFFEAVNKIQDLSNMIQLLCERMEKLRTSVGSVESDLVLKQKQAVMLFQKKRNLTKVLDLLEDVRDVVRSKATLDLLLSSSDYAGALDVLEDTRQQLRSQEGTKLRCLQGLGEELEQKESTINNMISEDFFLLIHDYLLDTSATKNGEGIEAQQDVEMLRESLVPLVIGMLRTGRLSGILTKYADMVVAEIRSTVEVKLDQILNSVTELTNRNVEEQSNRQAAEDSEGALEPQASSLLILLDDLLLLLLQRLGRVAEVASAIRTALDHPEVVDMSHPPQSKSKQPTKKNKLKSYREEALQGCTRIVQSVAENIQIIWAGVFEVAGEIMCGFDLSDFVATLDRTYRLWEAVQTQGGKQSSVLKSCISELCRSYLHIAHTRSIEKVQMVLDQDQWEVVQVPSQFQHSADTIFGKTVDGNDGAIEGSFVGGASKTINLGGKECLVTGSFLMLLQTLVSYIGMANQFRSHVPETMRHILELCKLYNSRTCQLVLGAKAMQTADLKSITAKHLGSSCASITALAIVFPPVRQKLEYLLPDARQGHLAKEMDRLRIELQVHRKEIMTKLITIMQYQLEAQLERLDAIPEPSGSHPLTEESKVKPSSLARKVRKQLQTLQNVLTPLLQDEDLDTVFGQVGAMYAERLAHSFATHAQRGPRRSEQLACDAQDLLPVLQELLEPRVEGRNVQGDLLAPLRALAQPS